MEGPGWDRLKEARAEGNGIILVVTHQSSFDLAGQAISAHGHPVFTMGLPAPGETMTLFNRLRTSKGLRIIPVGPRAAREAIRCLRRGEVVAIAADRPVRDQGTVVEFFGRPTLLPDAHVRLALQTGAELVCAYVRREDRRHYLAIEEFELTRTGDKETDVRENVQRVAHRLETFIRAHPEQWHMFQRLWD
jgi:KDO2-lipid IV(A) lauroyltransferase